MRGIEAGDLRGYLGVSGRGNQGYSERAAVARGETAGSDRGGGLGRGGAYAALANAVLGALRTDPVGSAKPTSEVRSSIDTVALALRDALAGDDSEAAVAVILKKVDDALLGAAKSLGLSDGAAQRLVGDFRSALADRVDVLAREAGGATPTPGTPTPAVTPVTEPVAAPSGAPTATTGPAPVSAVASASYRVVQKTGIELLTQEGDVVRISLRTKEGFRASGGYSPTAAYLDVASYSKSRFAVEVQGSLNADELAAINDVLGQVDEIATDFYAGNTASAFAAGAALDVDASQLAAVSLRMSQTTSLRVTARAEWDGASRPTPLPAPTPAPLPTPVPVPLPPATTGEATSSVADATAAPGAATPPAATSTAPTTSAGAADAAASTTTLRTMTDYLAKLVDTLGSATVSGRIEFSARAKLQLVVSAVDAARLPGSTTEAAGARMLGNVVDTMTDKRAV